MSKRFSKNVANLLEKAKESVLLAVDIYNKPKTSFRAGGFIVLMCVGWASLLHAIFERDDIKYFYKKRNGRYERIDGDKKAWELLKSAEKFYKNNENPIYKNILFFCKLRNKIEHRFMPVIDPIISGECQAFLLNFEELLVQEFGEKNSIIENLFIPLQFTKKRKSLPKSKQDTEIINFIESFRGSLSLDIADSQKYAFKAFFIPKLGNHRKSSDVAIEFVKFDPDNLEEMKKYQKMLVGIKEKTIPVANQGKYKPGDIYNCIKNKVDDNQILCLKTKHKFIAWNTSMWKKHKIRPSAKDNNYKRCNTKYCQYDEPHKDYIYTEEWVKFLIKELSFVAKTTHQIS